MVEARVLAYNDLEDAYDDPHRIGRLTGLIDELRDDRTVVCGAGDDTALGTVALLSDEGRGLARPFFEEVRAAAETFGNHDFDQGDQWALDWADSVPPRYCCANLVGPGTESIPPATVVERAGSRIGIVGVAHPETADICGSVNNLQFQDPVEAVAREERRLRRGGVDYVVVLSHGGEYDREVASGTPVDAVVGGHIHRTCCERLDGTLLVRTSGGGRKLAEVRLGEDPEAMVHETTEGDTENRIESVYRAYRDETGMERPIAEVDAPIVRRDAERFGGESRAGNFLADAIRRTCDADLALFPAGSLRDGPPLAGTVTVGEVVSLAPFADPVREVVLSGRQLREALHGVAVPRSGERGWVHAHSSGGRVRWSADGALRSVTVGGEPVSGDQQYAVATTGWLVEVSDLFDPISPELVVGEHAPVYRAAVDSARTGGLAAAERTGRIRKLE